MNYEKIYNSLIERARTRTIGGYVERHHIIPKCMGGSDDINNIVRLTAEEHYVAHQLLCKIYPLIAPLAYSMLMMAYGGSKTKRPNNKVYGWVRKRASAARTGKKRVLSDDARKAMADACRRRTGTKRGPMPESTKKKISAGNRGKVRSMETRAKLRVIALNDGRLPTPPWKLKRIQNAREY